MWSICTTVPMMHLQLWRMPESRRLAQMFPNRWLAEWTDWRCPRYEREAAAPEHSECCSSTISFYSLLENVKLIEIDGVCSHPSIFVHSSNLSCSDPDLIRMDSQTNRETDMMSDHRPANRSAAEDRCVRFLTTWHSRCVQGNVAEFVLRS